MEGSQQSLDSNKSIRKKEEIFFEYRKYQHDWQENWIEIFFQNKRSQLSYRNYFCWINVGHTTADMKVSAQLRYYMALKKKTSKRRNEWF